ncbi:MAG: hypothetical protein ACJ764_03385 [Solirubrobacteraceae bacterium]
MRRVIGACAARPYGAAMCAVIACGLAAVSSPAASPAMSHQAKVTVSPGTGGRATGFTVSFRAPDRAGSHNGERRWYEVSASGPTARGGCRGEASAQVLHARAHVHVRAKLRPGPDGWCAGTFHGSVTEDREPVCPPGEACPLYVVQVKTIGRFTFHVRTGGDTKAPVFAGLKSATACTPGPQRPGQTTPYNLSWDAASDNATPSSGIRYDIFMSTTSGGENFSQPNWTSAPGATSFRTPGLPSHGTVYFVVRALDRAGNEDSNQVERRGVDPCL